MTPRHRINIAIKDRLQKAITREALRAAVEYFGSHRGLGRAIGYTQPSISRILARGIVPPEMCVNIEIATEGVITRETLRPDIFAAKVERLIPNPWASR